MRKRSLLLGTLLILTQINASAAAELSVKMAEKEPPKELDASIRAKLQTKAVQLMDGEKPVFEFWFSAELPLQSKPAVVSKALDAVKQTTLIGAVAVSRDQRDYRDDELRAGIYTMRFVLQPQDGNHLGTSEFNYFAALTPARNDNKLDGIGEYKALVKASSKETSTDHPVILSLRPASSEPGEAPQLKAPAPEHKSVSVRIPAKAGDEKVNVAFEIVYEGKGHK